jgi:hypothetical protein
MQPTIGRIVIYYEPDRYDAEVPAIVTRIYGDAENTIDLTAFPPGGQSVPHVAVKQAEGGERAGRWLWPERA